MGRVRDQAGRRRANGISGGHPTRGNGTLTPRLRSHPLFHFTTAEKNGDRFRVSEHYSLEPLAACGLHETSTPANARTVPASKFFCVGDRIYSGMLRFRIRKSGEFRRQRARWKLRHWRRSIRRCPKRLHRRNTLKRRKQVAGNESRDGRQCASRRWITDDGWRCSRRRDDECRLGHRRCKIFWRRERYRRNIEHRR